MLLIFQTCFWFVSLTLHSIGTNIVTSCHFPNRSTTKLPQHRDLLSKNTYPSNKKKKAYQLNVKRPLADSLGVNKFEHLGEGGGSCTVSFKLNKFEHVLGRAVWPGPS